VSVFLGHSVVWFALDFKELSKRRRNTTPQLQLDELCTLVETLNNWTVVDRVGDVCVNLVLCNILVSVC